MLICSVTCSCFIVDLHAEKEKQISSYFEDLERKGLGRAFLFACRLTLRGKKFYTITTRNRRSAPNVGYKDCTMDAEVTLSPTGSSSKHYHCSGKANPKI